MAGGGAVTAMAKQSSGVVGLAHAALLPDTQQAFGRSQMA